MSSTASSTLSEQQIEDFKEAFAVFDKDGHGSIATKDLVTAIRSLGKDTTDVSHDGVHYDAANDANQTIDFSEFLSLMITEETDQEAELREAFKVFDKGNKGYITSAELRSVLVTLGQNLSVEEAEEIIREADIDGDGHVNFADFAAMMSKDRIE